MEDEHQGKGKCTTMRLARAKATPVDLRQVPSSGGALVVTVLWSYSIFTILLRPATPRSPVHPHVTRPLPCALPEGQKPSFLGGLESTQTRLAVK
jgi:hypothetical protein